MPSRMPQHRLQNTLYDFLLSPGEPRKNALRKTDTRLVQSAVARLRYGRAALCIPDGQTLGNALI